MSEQREYAYRFEYADKSACEIMPDGRMFLTWPNGKREEKHGQIDNRIPLLIGQTAKPRQDEIDSLKAKLAESDKDYWQLAEEAKQDEARLRSAIRDAIMAWDNEQEDIAYECLQDALTDEKGREYEPGMNPVDDAEFGMKP